MLRIAWRTSAPVFAEKLTMLMTPMPFFTSHFTGFSWMISRVRVRSIGLSRPGRTMVSLICVPGAPRILSTASSSVPP